MRRVIAALLAAALLLTAAGCASLFDRAVYLEAPYEAPSETSESEDAADTISNYAALRRAITRIVSEREESAELQFQNYEGTISRDISTACWEVKSSTALGAFAVDYISYDLSRIVSYTQAEIRITYKRSEYQMSALEQLENVAALRTRLEDALRAGETYLVLELTTVSLSADTVRQSLEHAYYADPAVCPVLPEAEVTLYPESGVQRIVEVALDYGMDSASLAARREELSAALEELLATALPAEESEEEAPGEETSDGETLDGETSDGETSDGETSDGETSGEPETEDAAAQAADRLQRLCVALADSCVMDASAGATAWDALAEHTASDEGMAMALEAACLADGIECCVVFGRLNGVNHVWNIVTVDGNAYHVDVSRWEEPDETVFLAGDEDLWGAYWWDIGEYPACPASFGEEEIAAELPSGEAASEESDGNI